MLTSFLSRKKYAKLKVRFELGTRENESLIREELRIEDLSKRIQEQNEYGTRTWLPCMSDC